MIAPGIGESSFMLNRRRRPEDYPGRLPAFNEPPTKRLIKTWRSVNNNSIPNQGEYVLHYQEPALRLAAQPDMDVTTLRMYLLAIGRMNDHGHAVFGSGELKRLLGKVDKETGELSPASTRSVYRAKRKLYEHKALTENTGGETCVWVAGHHAARKKKKTRCPVHWEFPINKLGK